MRRRRRPGWVRAWTLADGTGLAAVQTARGLLMHQAPLARDGRIADYRMVAPTEWNFHPQGALFRARRHRRCRDETSGAARRAGGAALDPCVGFRIEVGAMHEMSLAEGMLQIVEDDAARATPLAG